MALYDQGAFAGMQDSADTLSSQASSFKQNLPGYKQGQYNLSSDEGMKQLKKEQDQITKNANKRGLLYSGVNQGAQQGAQSGMASALANRMADINTGAENQSLAMANQAVQAQQKSLEMRRAAALQLYNQGLSQQNMRLGLIGGVFGGIGSAAGAYAGSGGFGGGGGGGAAVPAASGSQGLGIDYSSMGSIGRGLS